jgi:hypothetical protein
MRINETFRQQIDRRIEEVIKVDLADADTVALELDEYVVTDHIHNSLVEILDHYQETIQKPNEATNLWISGFFGSGKSSFAKVQGYLLEDPVVKGQSAAQRFLARSGTDRLRALLKTIHAQAATLSVFVDLSSGKNVAREGESVVLPLYRAVLERLGYSRDFTLAELEHALEGDGELDAFEKAFGQVSGALGPWKARRHVGLARNEASHALHLLRPKTYPSPDSWARSTRPPEITPDLFVGRVLELLQRRRPEVQRLIFVVDEVGQYVARSVERMFDLMGLAHAVQKKRGRIWLAVTSQEKLEDVMDNLEGRQVELARVKDRFPLRVDLIPEDIEEVVCRRVLDKNAEGRDAVLAEFKKHRNRLEANVRLDSPTRNRDFSAEEFARLYPLLPYQIQLFIDAVSAHRARGGAGPMLGGSSRTLIKLAQQLIVSQRTGLGGSPVRALATADMAYDLLESIIPTAWQAEIHQVAERHGPKAVATRATKAIAMLTGVPALKLTAANLAALLHPAVDAEGLRDQVAAALQALSEKDEVLRLTDDGYKLQSPEEKNWERERRGVEMRGAAFERLKRQAIQTLLGGLSVEVAGARTFRVQVTVEENRIVDGEIPLAILEREGAGREAVRSRSRESTAESTVYWVHQASDETHDTALELHRSNEMLHRKEGTARGGADLELLGEERKRQERFEKSLAQRLGRDLLAGTVFFRGVDEQPPGNDLRKAVAEVLVAKVAAIYPELKHFSAPVRRGDAATLLGADDLDGLPDYLGDEGLGIVRTTPQGLVLAADREPLASVIREVKDRAKYGHEATGKHLEEKFAGPPYGATVEAVQVLVAAAVRAGEVEALYQGARITSPADQRLQKVFGTLPGFRAATFTPQRELDPDTRARVARRLGELTGERPPIAADQLAARLRNHFKGGAEAGGRVEATFRGLGLPVPEAVQRAREIAAALAEAADGEAIKTCDDTWADLVEGHRQARRLDEQLDEATLQTLRAARDEVARGAGGLGEQARAAHAGLADVLKGPGVGQHLPQIRTLVSTLRQDRQTVWQSRATALRERVAKAAERIRSRGWQRLERITVEEALRPLVELAPPPEATAEAGPGGEILQARLQALDPTAEHIERQLEALASQVEIVRVRARELYDRVVTSEEELNALLERIRNAGQEALSQGKHFTLT